MKITVPERLGELTLGQLVAVGDLIDGNHFDAVCTICGLTEHQGAVLTKHTLKQIADTVEKAIPHIVGEYIKIYTSGEFTQSFDCFSVEPWEVEIARTPVKGRLANFYRKRELKRITKPETYHIMTELANEPANLWVKLLDGTVKAITEVKENEHWKAWKYFPDILAATAWRKGESRFTKDLNRNAVVDWDRVEKFKQVFLQIPARQAIKAVNFFLTINEIYLRDPNSLSLVMKLMTQTSSLLKPENSFRKGGVIAGT